MVLPQDSTILPIRNNVNHLPLIHVGISMLEAIPSHVITLSSHWHLVIFYFALISGAGWIIFQYFYRREGEKRLTEHIQELKKQLAARDQMIQRLQKDLKGKEQVKYFFYAQ